MDNSLDLELKTMQQCLELLSGLADSAARERVLAWLNSKLQVKNKDGDREPSLLELFSRINPRTVAEEVLLVASWYEQSTGKTEFTARELNLELKNLGRKPSNITRALFYLSTAKPQLVIATKPRGNAKQAQKTYRLTEFARNKYSDEYQRVD